MTTANVNRTNQFTLTHSNMPGDRKAEMIAYLRKKHGVPDDRDIIVKQGYIASDFVQKKALSAQAQRAMAQMHAHIDACAEEICDFLKRCETDEALQVLGVDWIHEQVLSMADTMFIDLVERIKVLAAEASPSTAILESKRFARILASLDKAKNEFKDQINEAFNTPAQDGEIQKIIGWIIAIGVLAGVIAVVLSSCEDAKDVVDDAAEKATELADNIAENERAIEKIETLLDEMRSGGIAMYEIILSGNENVCEHCMEMARQAFRVDEAVIGENAPPFHPNCGCSVREYVALSDRGVEMILSWEGHREGAFYAVPTYVTVNGKREAYRTIGYGHYMMEEEKAGKLTVTIDGVEYSELTEELARRLFWQDANSKFAANLDEFLESNRITLTQCQYDAVFMDMYQKGQNLLSEDNNSPLRQYLLAGDYTNYDACLDAFLRSVSGKMPDESERGRIRRRTDEANLFFYGTYKNN